MRKPAVLLAVFLLVWACGGSDDDPNTDQTQQGANNAQNDAQRGGGSPATDPTSDALKQAAGTDKEPAPETPPATTTVPPQDTSQATDTAPATPTQPQEPAEPVMGPKNDPAYNCTYKLSIEDRSTAEYCGMADGITTCYYHGDKDDTSNKCTSEYECQVGEKMAEGTDNETYYEVCWKPTGTKPPIYCEDSPLDDSCVCRDGTRKDCQEDGCTGYICQICSYEEPPMDATQAGKYCTDTECHYYDTTDWCAGEKLCVRGGLMKNEPKLYEVCWDAG